MSSVLGKRPAEGSLDNEPEAKLARTEPICIHINPDFELIYESNNEQKIKERVQANKTILMMYFDMFNQYFEMFPSCKEYQFEGSYDEWTLFIKVLRDIYGIRDGHNNIIIEISNPDMNILKMYEKIQLKPSILEDIIYNSLISNYSIFKSDFWPNPISTNGILKKPTLPNDKLERLTNGIKQLCKIIKIYVGWNNNALCTKLKNTIKICINNIYKTDNSTVICKFINARFDDYEKSIVSPLIVDKLYP